MGAQLPNNPEPFQRNSQKYSQRREYLLEAAYHRIHLFRILGCKTTLSL
jgi:hypothetical protein